MKNFKEKQTENQISWWKEYTKQNEWEENEHLWGKHNNKSYPHIIQDCWRKLLWKEIKDGLHSYLNEKKIHKHTGVRNFLSSWVLSVNLYFPIKQFSEFQKLFLGFLQDNILEDITNIDEVEFEYAYGNLLGETGGARGMNQTSPDIAFEVSTNKGKAIILTECKFTEDSFYGCSGRQKKDQKNRKGNPHPEKCLDLKTLCLEKDCMQIAWGRKYWDFFKLSDNGGKTLKRCPAATFGYQLLRQQALANGIAEKENYEAVFSTVAFDKNNTSLIKCLNKTGIVNFTTGWKDIYEHGADFKTWHHQDWVEYVRNHNNNDEKVINWLDYINKRYQY